MSDKSHILNELAFHVLKASDPNEAVHIPSLAILSNLNIVLETTTSEKLIEQIGQLLQFNAEEKKKKIDEKVKLISEVIHDVLNADAEFVTITLENGICSSPGVTLENLSTMKNVKICKDEASVKHVNEEISKLTENKLKEFINVHNKPKSGLTLFNLLHLKGEFCNIFRTDSTEIVDFHMSASKTIKVPMLKKGGMVMYNDDKDVGARVMYHSFLGCNFSVLVVAPMKKFGLAEMEKKLTAEKYSHLVKNMRSVLGSLSLPKVALNHASDLSAALKKSGLNDLFDSSAANLKKITKSSAAVDHFTQGVSINLTEFGSNVPQRELRDSEKYGMCCGGFTSPPEEQEIVANEPFLLVIHCHKGDSIVSVHRILEPIHAN